MSIAITRLREAMSKAGHSHILISTSTNLYWLTGFTGSFGYLLVSSDQAIFLTDSRYTIQAQEQVHGCEIRSFGAPVTGKEAIQQLLTDAGAKMVGFESAHVSHGQYLTWQDSHPGSEWFAVGNLIDELRMIKSADEISRIQKACELTDVAFDHILRLIQPGVTEFDIQLELEFFIRRNGAKMSFEPIIVSGVNSARPHGKATEKQLALGDFVTMDFGVELNGYCSDMTRTVVVGKADERTKEIYHQVLKAQLASLEMMRPGVVAEDVDAKAREVFDEIELAKYFGHGLGHGLGILVHDPGRLGRGSKTVLEQGHVWTVEPGVYLEGFGGCRIEDDVVVTETGIHILNKSTKELLELPVI
jgi:Xaa-Pro aminopeptidase